MLEEAEVKRAAVSPVPEAWGKNDFGQLGTGDEDGEIWISGRTLPEALLQENRALPSCGPHDWLRPGSIDLPKTRVLVLYQVHRASL